MDPAKECVLMETAISVGLTEFVLVVMFIILWKMTSAQSVRMELNVQHVLHPLLVPVLYAIQDSIYLMENVYLVSKDVLSVHLELHAQY